MIAVLDAVDEDRLGQLPVHVGADWVDAVGTDEADADVVARLVRLPRAAAERQGHREDSPAAGADDFLHLAVDPVGTLAALHVDLQLQCGQPGKLCADSSRQAQSFGVGVVVAGFAVDGYAVPLLDGCLLPVGHHRLDAELRFNLVVVNHAFLNPRFCQTGSIA